MRVFVCVYKREREGESVCERERERIFKICFNQLISILDRMLHLKVSCIVFSDVTTRQFCAVPQTSVNLFSRLSFIFFHNTKKHLLLGKKVKIEFNCFSKVP